MLTPAMFQNLQTSVANLNATTRNFQAASEKVNGVLDDAKGAVAGVNKAIDGAKDTLATADKAADDLRKAIGDLRKTLTTAREAVDEAVHGKGLVGTLISDRTLSDDLAALVSNLRRSGVLFLPQPPRPERHADPGAHAATAKVGGWRSPSGIGPHLRRSRLTFQRRLRP